jgi:hypothetical protein
MYKPLIYKLSIAIGLFFFVRIPAFSQNPLSIDATQSCSYFGETISDDLYEFKSSKEANGVISQIMSVMGLKPRFEIKAANVPNAAAVIYDNKRYILYSQNFISNLDHATRTDWGAISILAHEIGHHLNGHTLEHGGSRPSHELEADEFSGFILRKMGATLTEAQAAMRILADDEGSYTHPPKSARLEAIAVGWKSADESMGKDMIVKHQKQRPAEAVDREARGQKQETAQTTVPNTSIPVNLDKKNLIGKVVFDSNPSKDFYLTSKLNLITVTSKGIEVVGKLAESNVSQYPYMIYNTNRKYVYVANDGLIYNADQEKVGKAINL